jgi:DNA modification methylase
MNQNGEKCSPIEIEGVFLIEASNKNVFLSRKHILQQESGFYTAGDDSYEKPARGIYRIITMGVFESMGEIEKAMNDLLKHHWFYANDSSLLIDGKEIYCDGKWCHESPHPQNQPPNQ